MTLLSASIIGLTSFPIRDFIAVSGLVVAGLYCIAGYFTWRMRRAFVMAIVLPLFTLSGTFVLDFSSTAGGSPFTFFSQQAYLFIPEYLLIFYVLRAYRQGRV